MCPGKCKCGNSLDMRITEEAEEAIRIWIIFGSCHKCKIVYVCAMFNQHDKPVQDRDFMIDCNKVAEGKPQSDLLNTKKK